MRMVWGRTLFDEQHSQLDNDEWDEDDGLSTPSKYSNNCRGESHRSTSLWECGAVWAQTLKMGRDSPHSSRSMVSRRQRIILLKGVSKQNILWSKLWAKNKDKRG